MKWGKIKDFNLFRKCLSTTSGNKQKTVNRNQEKTGFVVKVVMVKVVKLNSKQGFELTIKYNYNYIIIVADFCVFQTTLTTLTMTTLTAPKKKSILCKKVNDLFVDRNVNVVTLYRKNQA